MISKSLLRSKTFWVQVLTVASTLVPAVREWVASNPEDALGALAALNIMVRFVTSGRVTLFHK